jgi:ABC-2 type transport system ATP-binding protein
MTLAIETSGLTRRFGARTAVDALDLQVPQGSIYAFLGPNGAGKTTTIRLLLGLLQPTRGDVRILGAPLTRRSRHVLQDIGSLVEAPSLYPHLTGAENLEIVRRLRGLPDQCVATSIERFGLAADAFRLVRSYSNGMRQSLALAQAWLGEPQLLLLDEPGNGLDPAAVRTLRALLRRVTDRGATVFLSSHILAEVEQIADWIGIVHKGRLRHQAPLASLKQRGRGSLEDFFMELVTAE